MRFGTWRAVMRLCVLTTTLAVVGTTSAFGQLWNFHTIPREVPGIDSRTGDVMQAPPIPYGEYAKDYVGSASGLIHGLPATAAGMVHALPGKICALCGGKACGLCGGCGILNGQPCGGCGGDGCANCDGHGRMLAIDPGAAGGMTTGYGLHQGYGAGVVQTSGHLCGPGQPCAVSQMGPSGQAMMPSSQMACHACRGMGLLGGKTCGLCGGAGGFSGIPCGRCHGAGAGCGFCGGRGVVDPNTACPNCGGAGCSACNGTGLCQKVAGLPHHVLGAAHGLVATVFHTGDIKYFVGPGGPVPLTPGYVPYVVTTRSPRDFFAFPPFIDQAQP